MGEQNINREQAVEDLRVFTQKLLTDLRALERMLSEGMIESDRGRIGAEQELFLVDENFQPAPRSLEVLAEIEDPRFTTELGAFNMEFNLDPVQLSGDCLRQMEQQLVGLLDDARAAADKVGVLVVLIGILPTLQKSDLHLGNMTPMPRYYALNDAMNRLRGSTYDLRIKGREELLVQHDNVMLEACNTSFQVHFQVTHEDFAQRYNIAQAVAAPNLACATNSPLLLGRRLWRETRIALFQQSIDTRPASGALREMTPRVSFGRSWVRESALEIFQEDIARFRVLLSREVEEDPFEAIAAGRAPDLTALKMHNGTVYRWNRPCYGISDGKPHLRIENRVLPAGPTPRDEMANAAFWFGLMEGMAREHGDISRKMEFGHASENFLRAARQGLHAHFRWPGHAKPVPAHELILGELLPLATEGLAALGIDKEDSDTYLGVIRERVETPQTGSQWLLESLEGMEPESRLGERLVALVGATVDRQKGGEPGHKWPLARLDEAGEFRKHYLWVEQIMATDLFTVTEDELVDLAAHVMNWRHVRHVPVEDSEHRLVGLVTHRSLLRHLVERLSGESAKATSVREIMRTDLVTVGPRTSCREALDLMRKKQISCLPVVGAKNRLVGIVTERDFMGIAGQLLNDFLEKPRE